MKQEQLEIFKTEATISQIEDRKYENQYEAANSLKKHMKMCGFESIGRNTLDLDFIYNFKDGSKCKISFYGGVDKPTKYWSEKIKTFIINIPKELSKSSSFLNELKLKVALSIVNPSIDKNGNWKLDKK